jgi:pantoate--beta-alanine ligase
MLVTKTLPELRDACASLGGSLGLVPTMGALHDGHLALVRAARAGSTTVAASIFVNPLQFAPNEDFARYPRDVAGDLAKLEAAGCDLVWLPDVETMYPADAVTTITVGGPSEYWEGAARPGHFTGVATVVAKLFGQVRPDFAYFGEKDWQQVQVIRRMVQDLLLPVEIVPVPTVREQDGLAMSSRNRFLSPAERQAAPRLYSALRQAAKTIASGEPAACALSQAETALAAAGMARDYLALVDAQSLAPLQKAMPSARIIAAARLGSVRLLDNVPVEA